MVGTRPYLATASPVSRVGESAEIRATRAEKRSGRRDRRSHAAQGQVTPENALQSIARLSIAFTIRQKRHSTRFCRQSRSSTSVGAPPSAVRLQAGPPNESFPVPLHACKVIESRMFWLRSAILPPGSLDTEAATVPASTQTCRSAPLAAPSGNGSLSTFSALFLHFTQVRPRVANSFSIRSATLRWH